MTVKVREIYPGHYYLVVDWHQYRCKRFASTNRTTAEESAKRLQEALDLYGADAIRMLEKSRRPVRQVPTLKAYAATWQEQLTGTDLRESTRLSYCGMLKKHLIPALGGLRLNDIDYTQLKAFALEKSHTYSRDTVRLMLASLRAVMAEAVRDKHIRVNPVQGLAKFYRKANVKKEDIDPFTVEELGQIENIFSLRFPDWLAFFLTLSRTGMRIGEAMALQVRDIDWQASEILIRRNLPHHRHIEEPKTKSSNRRVDMIPRLAETLRTMLARRREREMAIGQTVLAEANGLSAALSSGFNPQAVNRKGLSLSDRRAEKVLGSLRQVESPWLFSTAIGSPIHYNNFVNRVWNRAQALAKVRQRSPHDLRHTWASQMLRAGADPAWVAKQLGHSNMATTLKIYAHYVPGRKVVTADILDGELRHLKREEK